MYLRKAALALILSTASGVLWASNQFSLVLNGLSYHFPDHPSFNETNTGFGLQYDHIVNKRHRLLTALGTFTDSYFSEAGYVGGGYTYRLIEKRVVGQRLHADLGGVVMVAHSEGYRKHYGYDLVALPLPLLSLGSDHAALNMMYTPAIYGAYANVISMQVKFSLY